MKFDRIKPWYSVVGKQLKLLNKDEKKIPTFQEHKVFLIKSWPKLYKDYSDNQFEKSYNSYIEHLNLFNGFLAIGEKIKIGPTNRKDVIYLPKDPNSIIEIWLWKEYQFPFTKNAFKCEFFNITNIPDSRKAYAESVCVYETRFDNYKNPNIIEMKNGKGLGANKWAIFEII